MPQPTRKSLQVYILERQFPVFDSNLRAVHMKAMQAHQGADEFSDVVVDAVRRRRSVSNADLWPKEIRRLKAEQIIGSEPDDFADDARCESYDRARWKQFLTDVFDFKEALYEMDDENVLQIYSSERRDECIENERQGNDLTKWAHFNLPTAAPSFDEWTKVQSWTIAEAVALSLGKEPSIVTNESLQPFRSEPVSSFVRNYDTQYVRIERAVSAGKLEEPIRPDALVRWCVQHGINVADELKIHFGLEPQMTYNELIAENKYLKSCIESNGFENFGSKLSTGDVRYRNTQYKIILSMAIDKYLFKVGKRGGSSKRISDATIERYNGLLEVSDDTVYRHLVDAVNALEIQSSSAE